MQAIQTRYLPATNCRPSRIRAWCAAGSLTIGYPHELSGQECHRKAAGALVEQLGWSAYGPLLGGCLASGDYCFVIGNQWASE